MREWKRSEIETLLRENNKFLERSLLKIYERQTEDERNSDATRHDNGIGFNGVDAPFMSSVAKQILRSQYAEGFRLSEKQRTSVRKAIMKYAGQITQIANSKGE